MGTQKTSRLFIALFLGVVATALAAAPDAAADEREKEPETPAAGGLPVEDPTIDEREVPTSEAPEVATDSESDAPAEDGVPAEADAQPDEHQTPAEQLADEGKSDSNQRTTGAGPIEDPTLDITTEPDEVPPEVDDEPPEEPVEGETPEPGPEPEPEPEEGPNVSVTYDNGFLLGINDWFFLALSGLVQARYTLNYRTIPPTDPITLELDKQITQGFDVPRARFTLGIGLTQFVALVIRLGVVAGGEFDIQRAFIDLKWKHFRMRAGLFMNELIAESLVNPWDLLFADYSIVENVYTPGSSKGLMMTYLRKQFSINLGYSDGLRTGFSEIRSAVNADYALTLRAQYAWGKAGLSGFNRLNARRGTPLGIRLGVGLHYQDGGRTQGSLPVTVGVGTVDLSLRGNGWSALFSAIVGQDATDATATGEAGEVISGGVSVMGGYFVLEDLQVFGQYSVVPKPKIQGVLPPDAGVIDGEPSTFQAFAVGASYYVIPGYDNVKITTDFQYFLGHENGSLVPVSPLNAVQPNADGSQFAWRLQISGAF